MQFKTGLIFGLVFGVLFGAVGAAHAADVKPVTPTEYRDAQFISCMAGVSEASVVKNPDKVVGSCLAKAEKKTTAWQERKVKAEAKRVAKAEAKKAKAKAEAKHAAKVKACMTDTECEATD